MTSWFDAGVYTKHLNNISYILCFLNFHSDRNPDPSKRTPFKELIFELLQPEDIILQVPETDMNTHKLAGIIGGPLEAGENMYQELQTKYLQK